MSTTRRPALRPRRWSPPPLTDRARTALDAGPFHGLTVLPVPGTGPEDVLVEATGTVLTGVGDGHVLRIDADGGVMSVGRTGGRPLGLEHLPDGRVLVCDGRRGLLALDLRDGRAELLVSEVDGTRMSFCNNAAVEGDGTIWFTDSSRRFGVDTWRGDILEHGCEGRLIRRDPDGGVEVVLAGLAFANGVAMAPDGSWVVVAETGGYSLDRLWLNGDRAGERERFVDLPGFPDNISTGSDGLVWVAMASTRNLLLDRLHPAPGLLRQAVWRVPERLQPQPSAMAWVMAFDADGALVHDRQGHAPGFRMATGVRESGGRVWLGSLESRSVAWFDLEASSP